MKPEEVYKEVQDLEKKELMEEFFHKYPDAPNYVHEPQKFAFLVRSFLYHKGKLHDGRR